MKILVLNAGSSSHKSCLFDLAAGQKTAVPPDPVWRAAIDWTHQEGPQLTTTAAESIQQTLESEDRKAGLQQLLGTLTQGPTQVLDSLDAIDAVGHRVVHGGQQYQQSVVVTAAARQAIHQLIPLAPAHNPANLDGIEAMSQLLGETVPQVAVFDTAFHSTLPAAAATYPGPARWLEQGIRRYGFHGISHRYVAQRAAALLQRDLTELRLVTCHLGNGCSLAAVKEGRSVDTTMGFTPLDGLMMGSRSGSVDPGILIHLLRQGLGVEALDRLLNQESGLKGLSGVSGDLRQVLGAETQQAQLAFDVFIHRLRQGIGAMAASLGGLDALVFTAGIGENTPLVWQRVCENFDYLGLQLRSDLERSPADQDIAAPEAEARALVIHTREEWAIAQDCWQLLS